MALTVLTSDTTIYVRTTGNDSTGDGSSGSPYASVAKAIGHIGGIWPGDYTVTVDIGAGQFTSTLSIGMEHPFGRQVLFQGVCEDHASVSVTPGGTYTYHTDGLGYFDATFTKPGGSNLAVGDFVMIRTYSGGTRSERLLGCHEIISVVSSTVTVRIYVRSTTSTNLPSGASTCGISVLRTRLYFTSCPGIKMEGPYHGGNWQNLVIQGDADSADSDAGVWCLSEASIVMKNRVGVTGWIVNLYAQNNATIFGDYIHCSRSIGNAIKANNSAVVNFREGVVSGAKNSALYAFVGATIAANDCVIHSSGSSSAAGIYADKGGFIDCFRGDVHYCGGTAFHANAGGFIEASAATTTGCPTASSPTYDTVGNGNAYVNA